MPRGAALWEFRLLLLAGLAISTLSYVTNIFLANAMGPEVFGTYSYSLVLGALFGQLIFFGTSEVGVRLKISHGDAALNWILSLKLINFVLLMAAAFVSALIRNDLALVYGMIVALNSLCFTTHYEAQGRNVRYAVIYLFERALITSVILIGLLVLETGYLGWIFGTLALFQGASLAFQYSENRQYRPSIDMRGLLTTYQEGIYVLAFGLSKFSFGGVIRILIFNQLGNERMGIFSTAWQFVPLSTLYFAQATKAWRFRITESLDAGDASSVWRYIYTLAIVMMLPFLFVAMAFIFLGDHIIAFFFSSAYVDAGALMPYIGVYILVISFDSVVVLLAIATSRAQLASVIYLVFGGLTILACLFLVEGRSLEGYLAAIVIGHFLAAVSLAVFTTRGIKRVLQ